MALFRTHNNLEHLALMEAVMGNMPERFAKAGARAKPEFFREENRLDWPKAKASRHASSTYTYGRNPFSALQPARHRPLTGDRG